MSNRSTQIFGLPDLLTQLEAYPGDVLGGGYQTMPDNVPDLLGPRVTYAGPRGPYAIVNRRATEGGSIYLGRFEDGRASLSPWEAWTEQTVDQSAATPEAAAKRATDRAETNRTARIAFGALLFVVAVMALD